MRSIKLTPEQRVKRAAKKFILLNERARLIIDQIDKIGENLYQVMGTGVVEMGVSFLVVLNVTLYQKDSRVEII